MNEPIIEYREEFNVFDIARKYAERVARVVDEQTLANVEDQLAGYGYVKVVRCRDCKWCMAYMSGTYCDYMAHAVAPDGFCAWGERRCETSEVETSQKEVDG